MLLLTCARESITATCDVLRPSESLPCVRMECISMGRQVSAERVMALRITWSSPSRVLASRSRWLFSSVAVGMLAVLPVEECIMVGDIGCV